MTTDSTPASLPNEARRIAATYRRVQPPVASTVAPPADTRTETTALSDSEYVLSLIDETFGNVPQIKAHHDRMRKIAGVLATVATAPTLGPVPNPTALEALEDSGRWRHSRGDPETGDSGELEWSPT